MRIMSSIFGLALLVAVVFAPGAALAQPAAPKVIGVLTIDTKGDLQGFLGFVKRARAINQQVGTGATTRVWQATVAGQNAGQVFVGNEYANLVAWAQGQSKLAASPDWQKFIQDFIASGMQVVSSSLSVEVTP